MEFFFEPVYEENSIYGKNPEEDLYHLLEECRKKYLVFDEDLVIKAFYYCYEKHKNVIRKSGLPYYTHPYNVALILINEFPFSDPQSVAACLLHDTIEDVEGVLKSTIEIEFGLEIAEMVDGVTKISHEEMNKVQNKAQTSRKLFLSLVKDIRVVLIKLADRLHNIRTLHYMLPHKQKEIAFETLSFYTPMAHRLGLNKIKMELENLSFYYFDKDGYESIRTALVEKRREFLKYINSFTVTIQEALEKHTINHTLTIVHKHEYEIYSMMQDGKTISDIDNFYSIVIILNTNEVSECYRAHGVLATAFNSISFLDYIAHPKLDWYKSLHSELIGPDGKKVEILIRTQEMEKISEEGFASRYSLKDGRTRALQISDKEIEAWGEWMQNMIENDEENAVQTIWDSIKVNLFDSEMSVYSKEGRLTKLPKGSTIIDYAFALDISSGLHCISAKVNGVIRDISTEVNNGDQLEISLSKQSLPKPEWMQYVVSQRAVVQLYQFFNKDERYRTNLLGRPENFDINLKIIGEDKEGMLQKITTAIGKNNMKKLNLDAQEDHFIGLILLTVKNSKELNFLFAKLLNIKGINSVERLELSV